MNRTTITSLFLAGLLGLAGLVYGTHLFRAAEIKAPAKPPVNLPFYTGQVVIKGLHAEGLNTLKEQIPSLKVAYTFGPGRCYSLVTFEKNYPVLQVVQKLEGKCLWAEPHYLRRLYQDKAPKKSDKKKTDKKKKAGKKKTDKKTGKKSDKKKKTKEVRPPRDSYFRKQWAADNFGQDAPGGIVGKIGADIGLLKAWGISKGSKKILVAVLDTGVDYKHPDLEENIWVNEKEKYGIPGYDDDGNGYVDDVHGWNFVPADKVGDQAGSSDPMDDNGHGTHCSGIIGARANNFQGVVGVNWEVSIMGLKFLNAFGSGGSVGIYRGIHYAIQNKARVISCSFGSSNRSKLEEDAVKEANAAGVIIVAAAGNSGVSNDRAESYPANYKYDNVISVAATNNIDKLAEFSSFGADSVHVAAPGVDILSTFPGNRYGPASGTSMAAPMVSGLVALLLSTNQKLTPKEVKERIMATSDPIVDLVGRVKSWGRINAYNCLKNLRPERKFFDAKKVVEEENPIESIHYPTQKVDYVYKIVKPKAKYLRVHFGLILTDPNWDYVEILDKDNRKVDSITQYLSNSWSAWVKGDTIKIRLYAEPPFDFQTKKVGNYTYISLGQGKASRTWGFKIDKIGYVK